MPLPATEPPDEGGQIVAPDWHIPYSAVSWAYSPADSLDNVAGKVAQSPRAMKLPHCHADLFIRPASVDDQHDDDDLPEGELNSDLVGLRGALDAVELYESNVGFHWPPSPIEQQIPPDIAGGGREDHVALAKERWDELVLDLTGGLTIGAMDRFHESDDDSLRSLRRSTSTHSSIDLTDSDRSVLSVPMPATPRARRSYANIVVKNASPSRSASSLDSDRSPRRLNAAATTFVPSPSRAKTAATEVPLSFPSLNPSRVPTPPSPTFNSAFVFPTLNVPPLPSVKITKDAQGFYSEVESTPASAQNRPSSTLLPAFLHDAFTRRRPPTSKTRAIVDKLKSGSASSQEPAKTQPARPQLQLSALAKPRLSISEPDGDSETPSTVDDDGEGWIGGDDSNSKTVTLNPKTRRTRDLFLALTRRRSNSSPAKPSLVEPPADDVIGITVELPSPASSSNDGWIEVSALRVPEPEPKPKPKPAPAVKPAPADPKPAAHRPPQRAAKKAKRTGPPPSAMPPQPAPATLYHPPPPGPYYYPPPHPHAAAPVPVPVPVPYAAAYMHQMQVLQMQHQMHMRRLSAPVAGVVSVTGRPPRAAGGSGDWHAFAVPAYAMPMPALHPQPMFVPHGA